MYVVMCREGGDRDSFIRVLVLDIVSGGLKR